MAEYDKLCIKIYDSYIADSIQVLFIGKYIWCNKNKINRGLTYSYRGWYICLYKNRKEIVVESIRTLNTGYYVDNIKNVLIIEDVKKDFFKIVSFLIDG